MTSEALPLETPTTTTTATTSPRAAVAAANQEEKGAKKRKNRREFDWSKATFGHFVLKVAYVGTKYHGLAWQDPTACPNCPTVESKLFEALIKCHLIQDRVTCNYSRCGRTDKGVHAAGNYIALNLRLKTQKDGSLASDDYDYPSMLNGVLPSDVRILACTRAPEGFDARFSCKYRAYQYYFPLNGESLDRMQEAADLFVGAHDFRNFCKMDIENVTNYQRRVLSVCVREMPGGVAEFSVTGTAFLWHQVRNMVAVLLLVGAGLEKPSIVTDLLDIDKNPRKPIYEPANESGLVLFDCGFEALPFAPRLPPPPAGQTGAALAGLLAGRGWEPDQNMQGEIALSASAASITGTSGSCSSSHALEAAASAVPAASSPSPTATPTPGPILPMPAPTPAIISAAGPLLQSWGEARRMAAVQACLATAALAGCPAEQVRAREKYTPLLRRACAPSFEEKVESLDAKKRRKGDIVAPADDEGDE
eukprot:CAMPEP_0206437690 /NCGR_PEP_ID=MMETSP0324_2-20121206/11186_1 /ASSEMBLY_ACC=CAM_ASM_000836 /TAXON_ID=2866 /ORGANISM="Crypthecodinium cohnii, Strain Seligo" /LENGTH=477 /DNA_ID=CAMNT_0053905009 /DNA_START=70 /DNA_END=1503 /DNA_ORIENTATION=+